MSAATLGDVFRFLRRQCGPDPERDDSDAALLERFLGRHEQAAFGVLLERHGPMVLGVCRRLLADPHAAEDAFQATFVVLIRRAASIKKPASLASWLHGVARHVAGRARAQMQVREQRERRVVAMPQAEPLDELTWQELRGHLDQEIGQLPERCRTAVVLCYLEGKSLGEAARELGCPKSSVASRLDRARTLLRRGLVRRGVTLSAGALAAALGERAAAAPLPAVLTVATVQAASRVVAGNAEAALSARVLALAEETLRATSSLRAKLAVALLAVGLALTGAGLAGAALSAPSPAEEGAALPPVVAIEPAPQESGKQPPAPQPTVDRFGDPLPEGVTARLGTVRLRQGFYITRVAFALDGKTLVSEGGGAGFYDVALWDPATGKGGPLLHDTSTPGAPSISADGKWLVSAGGRLIELETGKELRRMQGIATEPNGRPIAIGPEGQLIAGARQEPNPSTKKPSVFHLWDATTGKELRTFVGHSGEVLALAFGPGGKHVASGSADRTVRLWATATGKEVQRYTGLEKPVRFVAVSPDGKIVAASAAQEIRLWDAESGKLLHKLAGDGELAFSADGKLLAGACSDGAVRLWNPATGELVRQWQANRGSDKASGLTSVAFAPDGKTLATAGRLDHAIRLWEVATGKEVRPIPGHTGGVRSMHFAADGKTLFSLGADSRIVAWDLSARQDPKQLLTDPASEWLWTPLAVRPDGKVAAVTASKANKDAPLTRTVDPALRLVDLATLKVLQELKAGEAIKSASFSADGKLLAADDTGGIRVWDTATGKELLLLTGQRANSSGLEFSPDGRHLAWCGEDRVAHLCDLATGKELQGWEAQRDKTMVLAFAPDGKTIATAYLQQVSLWSVPGGKKLARFAVTGLIPYKLAFSPSGRLLAISGAPYSEKAVKADPGHNIRLWDVPAGQEIRVQPTPHLALSALAFAPDGRTLATGGSDSTILLWDLTYAAQAKPAATDAKALDALWSDLAADAAAADRAVWTFARAGGPGLAYLQARLRPAKAADAPKLAALLADLDSPAFATREQAAKSLEDLGEAAEKALRDTLAGKPTLEVRQQILRLLEKRDQTVLRCLRAIEAVEHVGTAEARAVLVSLSQDCPNPQVADAARAAAGRLKRE
jgi:RNA polymerase sigma factor (sigma-70 family)